MSDDQFYMKTALELAARGAGYTSPNPMVGAVVVADGQIVGRGYHERVGGAHAEVNAIDDAGDRARGATLYVTLEPCNHTGRTPPCTHKIRDAGITRVVVAMDDPNPAVTGGGNAFLRARGIEVVTGVCERESRRLNEAFEKFVTTRRPFVILKCAATLDGRIATRTGDSRWVTGPDARRFVHRLRHAVDGILVGIETVRKDNPSLTTRLEAGGGVDPVRIILDSRLSISEDAKVLRQASESDTIIVCGNGASDEARRRLEARGARVLTVPLRDGRIDMGALMPRLGEQGITSLLIEGGGRIIASALSAGIVDKINFFYAPKILGGDDGVPICAGAGPERMQDSIPVQAARVHRFGEDIMIEGYINRIDG